MDDLGLGIFLQFLRISVICLLIGIGAWELFVPKKHCIKCDRIISKENYCPICGTPTDSVNKYNYWNKLTED